MNVSKYILPCMGRCKLYKPNKRIGDGHRYLNGQKRCQECEVFVLWDGIRCPCCNGRLRSKPKGSKFKKAFYARRKMSIKVAT